MKLFVTDMDGTLFTGLEGLSQGDQTRLKGLLGQGVAFTVATARTLPSALHALGAAVPALPMIVNNGALVAMADGQVLHEAEIAAAQGAEMLDALMAMGIPLVAVPGHRHGHTRWWWKPEGPSSMDMLLATHGDQPDFLPMPKDGLPAGQTWGNLSCSGTPERMAQVMALVAAMPGLVASPFADPYQDGVEVVFIQHADANKGAALRWLCDNLNADAAEATVFGDGLNDVALFEAGGTRVASAQACDALKRLAHHVLPEGKGPVDWISERIQA